jgi:hypothetical protein
MRLLSMLASPFNEHDLADRVYTTHGGFTAGIETTAFGSPGVSDDAGGCGLPAKR